MKNGRKKRTSWHRPVGRLLTSLAIPCIAAQVVNLLYNIVDRIYIGHIPEIGSDRPHRRRRHLPNYHDYIRLFALVYGRSSRHQ